MAHSSEVSGPGIDYSGSTTVNRNVEISIRYGVIAQNSVGQAWSDSAEPDYGEPTCPDCGNAVVEFDSFEGETDDFDRGHGCSDFVCEPCRSVFDSSEAHGDEALDWYYEGDGYVLGTCLDVNVFVFDAPFYTMAPFCSPCVPGAGDLDNAREGGVKTYCLGHDWFDDGKAPYPVYSVATGELVSAGQSLGREDD